VFRGLRLRLTALYLGAALLLLALVGGSAYELLQTSFQGATDQALHYRMAQEFRRYGAPLPPALSTAATAWAAAHAQPAPPTATPAATSGAGETGGEKGADSADSGSADSGVGGPTPGSADGTDVTDAGELPENYDAELAAIFVLPLDARGMVLSGLAASAPPAADRAAARAALAGGSDWRTTLLGGASVRLLSYRIHGPHGLTVLQLGRTLGDQNRVLAQFVLGLLGLSAVATLGLGAGSWWLAGRSLRPVQESWERQRAFVANASHELRAPLTLLRASAEVTRRHLPIADGRGRALLDDVLGECDHMARLVEDLLVLSKLDAGALALVRERVELPAFLADTGRRVGPLADERGVDLAVESGASGTVWADPARLRQVLLILLDNALRHTPAGGRVRVEARPQGQVVHLAVVDTGVGIALAHLPHLFERFYRADAARGDGRDGDGGSGLGLPIAKALVEAQGGEIHLTSRLGIGTRVEVTLPAART